MQILFANEELYYTVKIGNIGAGSAILKYQDSYNNNKELAKISFNIKTNKLIDIFYKLRDSITMIINSNDYSINEISKNLQQGKYKRENKTTIDYTKHSIFYKNQEINFNNKIYSPTSIIYYLRKQNLHIHQEFPFQIFDNGKIKNIIVKVIDLKSIKIKSNTYKCFELLAQSTNKQGILKEEMTFFIESENNHIPIIIKTKTKQGDMFLKLKKIINHE